MLQQPTWALKPNEEEPLKKRGDLHLARRFYHVLGLLVILVIFHNVDRVAALRMLALAIAIIVPLDFFRLRAEPLNRLLMGAFRPFLRDSEEKSLTGMTYLLCGVFLTIALFPREIATLSLFMLAFGDPSASLVGVRWGRDKLIGSKSLQGTLASFVVCTIVAAIFFFSREIMLPRLALASVLAGLIGAIAELFPFGKLDDNFSFPLLSASLLWVLFFVLGGFAGPSL